MKLDAVDKRLNEPSALISLLGNKAAIAGAVTVLGALTTLALALGYGGAKASEPAPEPPPAIVAPDPLGCDRGPRPRTPAG